jgi:hypothetical protein
MPEEFVQVPPDSTGKKLHHKSFNDGVNDVFAPVVHVADRTDPTRQQTVHSDGSARVSFATGNPLFDAFGRLLISDNNLLAAYKFYDGPKSIDGRIQEETTGAASIGYNSTIHGYTLQTSAAAGDSAKIISHRHFIYQPGSTITQYFVTNASDAGKTGLKRTMGMLNYAATDGICLHMEDAQGMAIEIRSSIGAGEMALQAAWNGDRLDGSGNDNNRSGATIDPTKANIFWITYQYLSVGAVTIGTYVNGKAVILHTFGHFGQLDRPYMAKPELAAYFEQTNIGSVGSTSEMNVFCVAFISSGYDQLIRNPVSIPATTKVLTDGLEVAFISLRPAQTYAGQDNRWRYLVETISAVTTAEPIEICLILNATLTGATWANSNLSLEWDDAATSKTGGRHFGSILYTPNSNPTVDLHRLFSDMTDGLYRNADITGTDTWTIGLKSLTGASTTVYASLVALEVQ